MGAKFRSFPAPAHRSPARPVAETPIASNGGAGRTPIPTWPRPNCQPGGASATQPGRA